MKNIAFSILYCSLISLNSLCFSNEKSSHENIPTYLYITASTKTSSKPDGSYDIVHTNDIKKLMGSDTPFMLVDSRPSKAYTDKRIPGAIHLTTKTSSEQIAAAIPSKQIPIIVYSNSMTSFDSQEMIEYLMSLGYTHVMKYAGGLRAWISSGNMYESAKN